MVLIIGLINLTGPQGAQAQEMMNDREARLKSLTLTYTDTAPLQAEVTLRKKNGSAGFASDVAEYTAEVDNAVTAVTVNGEHATPGTENGTYAVTYVVTDPDGTDAAITLGDPGKTTIMVVATEQGNFVDPDVPKMATYTIELTKRGPDVGENSPRLSTLTVAPISPDGTPGDAAVLSRKNDGGGQLNPFNPVIKNYVASIPFTATSVRVTAVGTDTGDSATFSETENPVVIVPDSSPDTDDSTAGEDTRAGEESTVSIGVGGTQKFTITARSQGGSTEYTVEVTRRQPELSALTLTPVNNDGTVVTGSVVVAGANPGDTKVFSANELMKSNQMAEVLYQAPMIRIYTPADPDTANSDATDGTVQDDQTNLGTRSRTSWRITSPSDATTTVDGHQVYLRPGDTTRITVRVDHWLDRNPTTTRTYNIDVKRGSPMLLLPVTDGSPTGGGLIVRDGNTQSGANMLRDDSKGRDNYYMVTVPYNQDTVTLSTANGSQPGDEPMEVVIKPDDADDGTTGHQVKLDDPGTAKTVTVTARSQKSRGAKTDYKIEITREETKLGDVGGTAGIMVTCYEMAGGAGTAGNTPVSCDLMPIFHPDSTTYEVMVDYDVRSVMVALTPGSDRRTAFTNPVATTSMMLTSNLVVGDNDFSMDVGVTANVLPNTSTYKLTVERSEPEPTLRFTLLDASGEELGSGSHSLELDAQLRTYDFSDLASATFGENDLLLMNSARVSTVDLDDGVRVSYNQVTVPSSASGQYLTIPDLSGPLHRLDFEVRYATDAGNGEDATTHQITIDRPADTRPMFPANDPLRGRTIVLLADEGFSPNGANTVVELPFARGGNIGKVYELVGDEAKGTPRIPADLSAILPSGSTKGSLTGIPRLLPESDAANHHLLLKVRDTDGITGASDEDVIEFTVRIVRDRSQITPPVSEDADVGELMDIRVMYDGTPPDSASDRDESAKVVQKSDASLVFDPNVKSYVAKVPTDVDVVDIYALASSSAIVLLNTAGTSDTTAGSSDFGSGTLHKWGGHKLLRGGAVEVVNSYTIRVADGGVTMDYALDVIREANIAPVLDSDANMTLRFYEGIGVGTGATPRLAAEKLPRAERVDMDTDNRGNGASVYELSRRLSTAPTQKNDFLGLMLNLDSTTAPTLTGNPTLDTDNPADSRLSDHSEVYTSYTVEDSDLDDSAGDSDAINIDIYVYRNVALKSYTVDGVTVSDLDTSTRMYRDSRMYSFEDSDIKMYTHSVAHDATTANFSAAAWDSADASVSYSPADADASTPGYQRSLSPGKNAVTVTVTNGAISATHVIDLRRPGLQASDIALTVDEDTRPSGSRTGITTGAAVELSPSFDRETYAYTAMVPTWVRSVQVSATPVDSNARAVVNTFEIPNPPGYSVVNLPNLGDTTNVITVGVKLGAGEPEDYVITITREADTAPVFDGSVDDLSRTVNRMLQYPIELPKATGGNGALTYSVGSADLPPGLTFNANERTISGTPRLDEGYSSDFVITYTVRDADGNTSAADSDSMTFTITITHDDVAERPEDTATPVDPADRNTLSDLVVTYSQGGVTDKRAMLSPAFMPRSSGPYSAMIPHDGENVQVTAVPAVTEAVISINNVRIAGGVKLDLPPVAVIQVDHPALEARTYTLNTVTISDSAPAFASEVEDRTFEANAAIDPVQLPMASGGNGALSYGLMDHQGRMPEGLAFNAATREISGTPVLLRDAVETTYRMTYMATDENGDSASLSFMITVCAAGMDCTPTMPEPNPGSTPMGLMVSMSSDGTSATLNWRPGDDATKQVVVALDPSDLLASAMATIAELDAEADSAEITGLTAGVSYIYIVLGYDSAGNYKDASGNLYSARYMMMQGN
ncbi:MAG: cadherin-like beta sandwich domain-containing protein [Dehalococcoidia bacterium]|nr:cadherin-like beta sandwich domain-containing protein [Dehalococcoidia bacterium]